MKKKKINFLKKDDIIFIFTPLESLKLGDFKNIYIYKVFLLRFATIGANVREIDFFQD